MDKKWEIATTIVVGVGIALWFAFHKGQQNSPIVQQTQRQPPQWGPSNPSSMDFVPSAQPTMQSVNYLLNDGWTYIPNSFNINLKGGDTFNIVIDPLNLIWKPTPGDLVPLNVDNVTQIVQQFPINLSPVMSSPAIFNVNNGTPQCGCGCPKVDFTTMDQIAANLQTDYLATLAAILNMKPVQPASDIHVNIIKAAPPVPTFTEGVAGTTTTTDAGGNQSTRYTGSYGPLY